MKKNVIRCGPEQKGSAKSTMLVTLASLPTIRWARMWLSLICDATSAACSI